MKLVSEFQKLCCNAHHFQGMEVSVHDMQGKHVLTLHLVEALNVPTCIYQTKKTYFFDEIVEIST